MYFIFTEISIIYLHRSLNSPIYTYIILINNGIRPEIFLRRRKLLIVQPWYIFMHKGTMQCQVSPGTYLCTKVQCSVSLALVHIYAQRYNVVLVQPWYIFMYKGTIQCQIGSGTYLCTTVQYSVSLALVHIYVKRYNTVEDQPWYIFMYNCTIVLVQPWHVQRYNTVLDQPWYIIMYNGTIPDHFQDQLFFCYNLNVQLMFMSE